MGRRLLQIYLWAIVHVPSQPPRSSAAGLVPSASALHAPGHGVCWLNFYDAASFFFVSAHSANIQGQTLFCGLEKSEQTMGVCGKSFSPVLGAGDVWKGTQFWALPSDNSLPIYTGGIQPLGFGIGAPLRMCRGQ